MATPNLPAIPETLVKRLYKAYRLRRRADVLAYAEKEFHRAGIPVKISIVEEEKKK
jgi:hypothetical protein